jgi:hypothetical protein
MVVAMVNRSYLAVSVVDQLMASNEERTALASSHREK